MAEDQPEQVNLPVSWVDLEEMHILFANQFIVQIHDGDIVLSAGQFTPPVLLGETMDQLKEQLGRYSFARVTPVARLGFTRKRLGDLIEVLTRVRDGYDADNTRTTP